MAEGGYGVVPGGDELLGDVAFVAGFDDLAEDGGVVDFLGVIEFGAAGVAGGVVVADELVVLADAADDVAVHDGDVVDVEEEFEVGRADAADEVEAEVGVVAEVAGMAFHRVGVVAGVEVLTATSSSGAPVSPFFFLVNPLTSKLIPVIACWIVAFPSESTLLTFQVILISVLLLTLVSRESTVVSDFEFWLNSIMNRSFVFSFQQISLD